MDGEGMAYAGPPFTGNVCHVPDAGNIFLVWNYYGMGYCFCIYPPF